jgi:hypothetical protein
VGALYSFIVTNLFSAWMEGKTKKNCVSCSSRLDDNATRHKSNICENRSLPFLLSYFCHQILQKTVVFGYHVTQKHGQEKIFSHCSLKTSSENRPKHFWTLWMKFTLLLLLKHLTHFYFHCCFSFGCVASQGIICFLSCLMLAFLQWKTY